MCVYKHHQEWEKEGKAKRPPEAQMKHIKEKCYELFGQDILFRMEMRKIPRHFHFHVKKRKPDKI
jgi:hypothetical protein